MLTVDFDRLGVRSGSRLLDLGSGPGRHAFEAYRRGAHVVCADLLEADLRQALGTLEAMREAGQAPAAASAAAVRADALRLPFPDAAFDHVVVSEVFEHIPDDLSAMREVARVLKPGGSAAVSVPRWFPEQVCWALSDEYHANAGGHVRIYRGADLTARLAAAGLRVVATEHAHALHAPYWWLKCACGVRNEAAFLPRQYHRLLVWDIVRPNPLLRRLERALNPLLGKSFVAYLAG